MNTFGDLDLSDTTTHRHLPVVVVDGIKQKEDDILKKYAYYSQPSVISKSGLIIPLAKKSPVFEIKESFESDSTKFFIRYVPEFGHVILETMVPLFDAIGKVSDLEVIIDISNVKRSLDLYESFGIDRVYASRFDPSLYLFMIDFFKKRNIKHTFINFDSTKDVILVNNFYTIKSNWITKDSIDGFVSTIDEEFDHIEEPYRKVYLSRKKVLKKGTETIPDSISDDEHKDDNTFRILREEVFEDFVKSRGFEIIYPEDFKNFSDQIKFMRTVKVLCSATSSGLGNMLFMKRGGTIVQLFTPLTMPRTDPKNPNSNVVNFQSHLHTHYHELCYLMRHDHLAIFVDDRDSQKIVDRIESSPNLRHIFD